MSLITIAYIDLTMLAIGVIGLITVITVWIILEKKWKREEETEDDSICCGVDSKEES